MRRLHILFASLLLVAGFAVVGAFVGQQPARAQDGVEGLDMNEIFRCFQTDPEGVAKCDEARSLILGNCVLCHMFVPIVLQQFDAGGWQSLIDRHRIGNRVDALSDEQVKTIQDYLTANFNPEHEPPELPKELLENWTSY